jgi:hypothetical protein
MSTRNQIIVVVILLVGAFAAGRWAAPTKIVTKTVEVEKQVTLKDDKKEIVDHSKKKITVTRKPDGTKTTIVEIGTDVDTKVVSNDKTTTDVEKQNETTKQWDTSKVTISALGGYKIGDAGPLYGASISKPILGPITVGAWALSNSTFGASLGLTF